MNSKVIIIYMFDKILIKTPKELSTVLNLCKKQMAKIIQEE